MENVNKYSRQFFPAPCGDMKWTKKNYIEKAPIWCSVDLRDGNQSLIVPMNIEEKLDFFNILLKLGFKEIEVGFPASSETEYNFLRMLIEQNLIPDDVTIQVLTPAREHIIKKTFESLRGAKNAIVHLYNSTSVAQREQVFKKSKQEIIDIAVEGARLFKKLNEEEGNKYRFEYSPESFTCTEPEFSLEICNAVLDVWKPSPTNKVIINLPVTVQISMSHVYANQVEYMSDNLKYRENVILSLHPHNDRGCAISDTEMGILAGAQRVEGTLFGNGERTGNVDLITLALNMYSQGIDPNLDFSDLPSVTEVYERDTHMQVYDRLPYSGKLVFAAFSGSHQDAIAKGIKWREEHSCRYWTVPYLSVDPKDIGREYETDVIRINSQSGKGGIGYLLEHNFGYVLPAKMREHVGYTIKSYSDRAQKELSPDEVNEIFQHEYVNIENPIKVVDYHFVRKYDSMKAYITIEGKDGHIDVSSDGNGRLDAVSNAIKKYLDIDYSNLTYNEHGLSTGSSSKAVTYVSITSLNGKVSWGAGIHDDIISASINAIVSAVNRMLI